MAKVIGVIARSENSAIGINGELPFNLKDDLKHFKELTKGHTVMMGRKTMESIGRPLPDRKNVVATTKGILNMSNNEDILFVMFPDLYIEFAKEDKVFVIGGEKLINSLEEYIDEYFVTEVHAYVDGDSFFNVDLSDFNKEKIAEYDKSERNQFPFSIYHYKRTDS